jgi:hypothetical protein
MMKFRKFVLGIIIFAALWLPLSYFVFPLYARGPPQYEITFSQTTPSSVLSIDLAQVLMVIIIAVVIITTAVLHACPTATKTQPTTYRTRRFVR